MKKVILKISIILFFISIFIFNNNCLAFTSFDYTTAFNSAVEYLEKNNYNYYDYVIFNNNNCIKIMFFINENYECYVSDFNNILYDISNYYIIFSFDNISEWGNGLPIVSDESKTYAHFPADSIVYSSFDIINKKDNSVYFEKNELDKFHIILSTTEKTNEPITAYTNYFNSKYIERYKCYISTDGHNWDLMNYGTLTDPETNTISFRFFYYILDNGTYYFKFIDKETDKEKYITITITNISYNSANSGFTDSGIPQPHISYKKVGDYFSIKTQSFTKEEILKYKCLYTSTKSSSYEDWNSCSIGTITNPITNETEFYFFTTIPIDSEIKNNTLYFVFYDTYLKDYGYPISFTYDIEHMKEYSDKVGSVIDEKQSKFNELINFFKERFGFLTFPFEFIADLLNRILTIEYSEPIIRIPQLYIPGTNQLIFSGYEYNFNTLLENQAISNIYNIYLVAVDFIIVLGVIVLAKDTLMEVFGNG